MDDDGNKEACEISYDSERKEVSWKTDHLSVYMIGYDESLEMVEEETVTEEVTQEQVEEPETDETKTDETDVQEETNVRSISFSTILLILALILAVLAGLRFFLMYKKKKDVAEK